MFILLSRLLGYPTDINGDGSNIFFFLMVSLKDITIDLIIIIIIITRTGEYKKKVISAQHWFEPPLSQGAFDESDVFVKVNTK